ncbi:hypothetical protein HDE_08055 [Halotydeus destructor]|nr:hypothetical protein HDE_08055 [Halotydeus destructor]
MWPILYVIASMYAVAMKAPLNGTMTSQPQPLAVLTQVNPDFTLKDNWDCGVPGSLIRFKSASITPDPIPYPGQVMISSEMEVIKEIPKDNFFVKLNLEKTNPRKMKVPCMHGMGSCSYDICNQLLPKYNDIFCNKMGLCSCPFEPQVYSGSNVPYNLPERGGPAFAKIMQGNYVGNLTFYNKADGTVYGCMGMKFTIKSKIPERASRG